MPHTANGRHTPSTLKRDNTVQVRLLTKPSDGLTAVCRRLAKIRRDMDETIQKGRLKNKFQTASFLFLFDTVILTGFQFECFGIPASAPAYRQADFATAFAAQAEEDAAVALGG